MGTKPRNILKSLRVKDFLQVDGEITGRFMNTDERYSLIENFRDNPAITADKGYPYSTQFEVLGTNATTALATWSAVRGGLLMTTAGADNDQIILAPHLTAGYSAWTGVKWGTENQVIWEATLTVGDDITNGVLLWAGLKLTNTPVIATDNDQVFFRFSTDDSDTTWHCISSIGGTDTNTNSGVTVAINTKYKLRIEIDSARKAYFYINDNLVANTAALTNDVNFIPYVGIQALNAAAEFVTLHNEKISRILFE